MERSCCRSRDPLRQLPPFGPRKDPQLGALLRPSKVAFSAPLGLSLHEVPCKLPSHLVRSDEGEECDGECNMEARRMEFRLRCRKDIRGRAAKMHMGGGGLRVEEVSGLWFSHWPLEAAADLAFLLFNGSISRLAAAVHFRRG